LCRAMNQILHDLRYAVRGLRRAPLVALTIVFTVGLGLGLVTVVFTLLNTMLFRVDAVRDPQSLVGVERPKKPGGDEHVPFTRPEYEALRRDTSEFTDVAAVLRGNRTRVEGRPMGCALVTGNFFQLLGVPMRLGRPLEPADDVPHAGREVIVLSHSGWMRWFAQDPDVIGRTLPINGRQFEIVGVAQAGFRGLTIGSTDYFAPLSLVGHFRRPYAGREDQAPVDVIGRLKPGHSIESAATALTVWASAQPVPKDLTGPVSIRVEPRQGTVANDMGEVFMVFTPLFFAFGLILAICCANVVNLQLARGLARQREIATRLSLGASRPRIIRQLVTESLLLAVVSAAVGLVFSRLTLVGTIYAAMSALPPEVAEAIGLSTPPIDWRVVLFLLGGASVSTVFFGLAPALQSTRLDLVRTMRGDVRKDGRPGRVRNLLIGAQVGASALLLICAAVFLRSAFAASSFEMGMRTEDTVSVEIATEQTRPAIVGALQADPSVEAIAASRPGALESPMPVEASAGTRAVRAGQRFVSPEYFDVLDIPLRRGRSFDPSERSDRAGVAVISDTAAQELWPGESPLGQALTLQRDEPSGATRATGTATEMAKSYTVVGVVADVPGSRFGDWPRAGIYLPIGAESTAATLTLRVHGDPDQVRLALFARLTSIDPALDDIGTLRGLARIEIYLLGLAFWIAAVLAGLALAFTLSGLFSVLSFVVEQRRKEIGVRMALGATAGNVVQIVLSRIFKLVGAGLVAGSVLAALLTMVLLSTPLASLVSGTVQVFDPVAYAGSALCIVLACLFAALVPARRAARIDPMTTLRQD
jgi:predicted permease